MSEMLVMANHSHFIFVLFFVNFNEVVGVYSKCRCSRQFCVSFVSFLCILIIEKYILFVKFCGIFRFIRYYEKLEINSMSKCNVSLMSYISRKMHMALLSSKPM